MIRGYEDLNAKPLRQTDKRNKVKGEKGQNDGKELVNKSEEVEKNKEK